MKGYYMIFDSMKVNKRIYFKVRDFLLLYNYLGQLKRLLEVSYSMSTAQKRILYPSEESPKIFIRLLEKNRENQPKGTFLYWCKCIFKIYFLTELQLVECCILLEDALALSKKDVIQDIDIKGLRDRLDQYFAEVFDHKFII